MRHHPLHLALTHLGRGVDGEGQHRLLPVLHLQALQEQGGEPGPCAATKAVKHQETLNSRHIDMVSEIETLNIILNQL